MRVRVGGTWRRFYIWITYSPLTPDTSAIHRECRRGRGYRGWHDRRRQRRSEMSYVSFQYQCLIFLYVLLGFELFVLRTGATILLGSDFDTADESFLISPRGWHLFAFRNIFSRQRALFSFLFILPLAARFSPLVIPRSKNPTFHPRRSHVVPYYFES